MDGSQLIEAAEVEAAIRTSTRRSRLSLRQALMALLILGVVIGSALYGRYYWTTGRFLVSTDDATVQADSVIISPRVSGYISDVLVNDNQSVQMGAPLARIDDRDYRTALDAAQASLAADLAGEQNLQDQINQQRASVLQAQAVVEADRAALTFSQQQSARYAALATSGAGSVQNSQQWRADILEKQAAIARDAAGVAVASKRIDVLTSALGQAKALVTQQQAAVHQAELNLGYTAIASPISGVIDDRTLRVGQYVQAGTQLMALVPLSHVYITANFEETQLTNVEPGQKVAVSVDAFPGIVVQGVVDSIAPASSAEFALLPPDNATGNFTKIVQRVSVKIAIDPADPLSGRLRPGMSVEPVIDTRSSQG